MNWKQLIKRTFKIGLFFSLGLLFVAILGNCTVNGYKDKCFDNVNDIPTKEVGLVLGCSKYVANGGRNPYFIHRVNAAAELYKAGKIEKILVSGDNGNKSYDEPEDFTNALVEKGVPRCQITQDYAGFRTFDSMVRAKKVFGLSSFTIISQEFHNKRALFIAHANDIDAVAYNAHEVSYGKHKFREYLARTKAFLDVYVLFTSPKFLGKDEILKGCN